MEMCFWGLYQSQGSGVHRSVFCMFYNTQTSLKGLGDKDQSFIHMLTGWNNKNFRGKDGTILPAILFTGKWHKKEWAGEINTNQGGGPDRISLLTCNLPGHLRASGPTSPAGFLSPATKPPTRPIPTLTPEPSTPGPPPPPPLGSRPPRLLTPQLLPGLPSVPLPNPHTCRPPYFTFSPSAPTPDSAHHPSPCP